MSLPEVTEIRLIVTTDRIVTPGQVDYIKVIVRAALALPDEFPVLVHGPDVIVEVVTA